MLRNETLSSSLFVTGLLIVIFTVLVKEIPLFADFLFFHLHLPDIGAGMFLRIGGQF